jgi:choline dehydrogenase-like flavoprotein
MSSSPEGGVVGLDFRVHGTDNLYVVDSSVFPTNLGVNPQLSIMALARLAAERLAA